jgi:hypothetical protein
MMGKTDPRYNEAVALVRKYRRGSITLLQRHMQIGYHRAHALIDAMVGTVLTDMPPVGKIIPEPITAARADVAEMERAGNADDIEEARVHLAAVEHSRGVPVSQTDGDEDIIAPLPQRLAAALVEMAEGKPRGTGSILLQAAELLATYGVKVAHDQPSVPPPTHGSAKDNQALRTLARLSDEMGEEL